MEISILDVNFIDDDTSKRVVIGNIFGDNNPLLEKIADDEVVIGEETTDGLNIRFVDKSEVEVNDFQK